GQLSRSNASANRLASHQLGPPRPRHLRHHDRDNMAPAHAGPVRNVRVPGAIKGKEPAQMSTDRFDGEAISRADREFLTRLGDHPLLRNPLYSAPPPLLPNYAALASAAAVEAAQKACFEAALDWLLVNYAFSKSAFMGKGGIVSLVDGEMGSLASLRGFMQYALVCEGPRGGTRIMSAVDDWM